MRAHGIRGTVLVRIDPSAYGALHEGLEVAVTRGRESCLETTVARVAPHRTGAAIDLRDVTDRDAAAALAGCELRTERGLLPKTANDEYYACDLVGATVLSPDGKLLGVLEDIIATGANDVWVVVGPSGELLVPAVAHAVLDVDAAARRIVVDPNAATLA